MPFFTFSDQSCSCVGVWTKAYNLFLSASLLEMSGLCFFFLSVASFPFFFFFPFLSLRSLSWLMLCSFQNWNMIISRLKTCPFFKQKKKKKRRLHPGYFRIWGVRTAKPQADLRLLWSVEQMQRSQSRGERQNNVKTSWSTTWNSRLRCGTAAPPQTCIHRPHLYALERYIKRLSALGFLL